ncbi:MAG: hypothetical protein MZV64_23325 [Ignavibacteriales bacterium]|nr:hypothetical protein [Ignavibacteriales bacterium]
MPLRYPCGQSVHQGRCPAHWPRSTLLIAGDLLRQRAGFDGTSYQRRQTAWVTGAGVGWD